MTTPNASLTAQAAIVPPDAPQDQANIYETLVGEGKKYKTPEELAKAYFHANNRIVELDETVAEANEHKRLFEEILNELRSKTPPTASGEPPAPSSGQQPPPASKSNPEDVAQTVEAVLTRKEQEREAKNNQAATIAKMKEAYGVDDQGVFRIINKITKERPELADVLDKLGNTNPEACVNFIMTLQPAKQVITNTPGVSGGPSAHALVATQGGQLTWSQAKKVRKEDPKTYNSKEFRDALYKAAAAAEAKGVDFYNT